MQDGQDPGAWARPIPKAEIHLHLEGSVELDTLVGLLRARGEAVDGGLRARLAALYTHRDFRHFLENFRVLCGVLRGPQDFARITASLSARLESEGVAYAEVFCSPSIFERAGLPPDEILDAVSGAARRREAEGGPRLRFLLDGVRQFGVAAQEALVDLAAGGRVWDVIGIGLGGDEQALPTRAFAGPYREARRLGLRTTVHAGEFDGPRSVWEAVEILEAERVGHGVRAVEDPMLVTMLARHGVPLECCPTSNIRTGVVRSWAAHPLRRLREAGVTVTLNSDDPALFGTTLLGEWETARDRLGLAAAEVAQIGVATAAATFLPEEEKTSLVERVRAGAAAVSPA